MPLALFASSTFIGLNLLTFFLYGSLGGLLVLLPYRLIKIEHWSALAAGMALLPLPLVIGGTSRYMGRIAARSGSRLLLACGAAVVGLGMAAYTHAPAGIDYWRDIMPPTLLVALGMGACVAPLTTSVIGSVDSHHVGIASGFNSAMARIAGLIATALLGSVFDRAASVAGFLAACRFAAWLGAASAAVAAGCALRFIESEKS